MKSWLFFLEEIGEEEWVLLQIHMAYCPDCMMTFRLMSRLPNLGRPESTTTVVCALESPRDKSIGIL